MCTVLGYGMMRIEGRIKMTELDVCMHCARTPTAADATRTPFLMTRVLVYACKQCDGREGCTITVGYSGIVTNRTERHKQMTERHGVVIVFSSSRLVVAVVETDGVSNQSRGSRTSRASHSLSRKLPVL